MAEVNRRLYLLYLLYLRRKKRKSNRNYWIHPIIKVRYLEGTFYTLFDKLVEDKQKFYNYFRMSKETFDYIAVHLRDNIRKEDTTFRMAIPPDEMLCVTIRYLASGNTLTDLHYSFRIGISTLSNIIHIVCNKIWTVFRAEYLKELKEKDWEEVAEQFTKRANFPMCLGAIDGKHIRIQNFPHAGSVHFNYKMFYSIVLLAIVDSNYKFLFVDIGAYGKDCDSSILQCTEFWRRLTLGKLNIPQAQPIPPKGIKVPYVFVADSAFAINEHILKEFANNNMSVKQRVFNYRLHRARRYVECAFGILSNKWRIFHRPLNVSKCFSKNIVKACVILHNVVRVRDVGAEDDEMIVPGSQFRDLISSTQQTGKTGKGVRTNFANYFICDEGKLHWQLSKI